MMYVRAVKSFDTFVTGGSLKEVHFVDITEDMLQLIQQELLKQWGKQPDNDMLKLDTAFIKQCLNDIPGSSSHAAQSTSSVHPTDSTGAHSYAEAAASGTSSGYKPSTGGGVQIVVYQEDIFRVFSDAIVCWKNPAFVRNDQVVAHKVYEQAGQKYKKCLSDIKKKYNNHVPSGLVFAAPCENMKQKLIIHGIIDRFHPIMTDMQKMIPNIIAEVHQKKLSSVVFPIFKGLVSGLYHITYMV